MLYVVKQNDAQSPFLKADEVIRHRSLEVMEQNKRKPDLKSLLDKNDSRETLYLGFVDKQYGLVGSARMVKASEARLERGVSVPRDANPKAWVLMDCQFYVPEGSELFKCPEATVRSQFQNMCQRFYESLIAYMETRAITASIPEYYFFVDEEALFYLKQLGSLNFKTLKAHQPDAACLSHYLGNVDTSHLVHGPKGKTRRVMN